MVEHGLDFKNIPCSRKRASFDQNPCRFRDRMINCFQSLDGRIRSILKSCRVVSSRTQLLQTETSPRYNNPNPKAINFAHFSPNDLSPRSYFSMRVCRIISDTSNKNESQCQGGKTGYFHSYRIVCDGKLGRLV